MADEYLALANPDGKDEQQVDDDYLAKAQFAHGKAVDGAQCDDDEEVCHLPDGNLLGAVADDAEYCKESQCDTGLELYVAKHVYEHECTDGNENVCEEELTALALWIVESAHYNQDCHKVDEECQQQRLHVVSIDELVALALLLDRYGHLAFWVNVVIIVYDYCSVGAYCLRNVAGYNYGCGRRGVGVLGLYVLRVGKNCDAE